MEDGSAGCFLATMPVRMVLADAGSEIMVAEASRYRASGFEYLRVRRARLFVRDCENQRPVGGSGALNAVLVAGAVVARQHAKRQQPPLLFDKALSTIPAELQERFVCHSGHRFTKQRRTTYLPQSVRDPNSHPRRTGALRPAELRQCPAYL